MILVMALAAALAGELTISQVCPGNPIGNPCGAEGGSVAANVPSAAGYVSDPVSIGAGHTLHTVADVRVATPSGPLEFRRFYVSTTETWKYAHLHTGSGTHGFITDLEPLGLGKQSTPTPFGTGLFPYSLQWWNNFYSMVLVYDNAGMNVWRLVDRAGRTVSFAPCGGVGCEAVPDSMYGATQYIMRRSAGGFEVLDTSGERLVYESLRNEPQKKYFLTRGYHPNGAKAFEIAYGAPLDESGALIVGCPSAPAGSSSSAVPYISSIWTTGDAIAGGERLAFYYKRLERRLSPKHFECVIARVNVEPTGKSPEVAAIYSYAHTAIDGTPLGEHTGFLSAGGREQYVYPDGLVSQSGSLNFHVRDSFETEGSRREKFTHGYIDSLVTQVDSRDEDVLMDWDTTESLACSSGVVCCAGLSYANVVPVEFTSAGVGDGTSASTSSPGFVRKYATEMASQAIQHETRVRAIADACPGSQSSCSQGTFDFEYSCAFPGDLTGVRNKRGAWTTYERAPAPATAGMPARFTELKKVKVGASSSAGPGLEEVGYSYAYGPDHRQFPEVEERVSVLAPTTATDRFARTRTFYDTAFTRVSRVIKSGWTMVRTGPGTWTSERKYIGTFYFNQITGATSPDPLNRIVEVHGPCFVSSDSATGCSGTHPVTQFIHHAPSAAVPERDRVSQIKRYPAGLAGPALVTEILEYDARGNPTQIKDPSGAITTLAWSNGDLASITKGPSVWQLAYDGGQLSAIQYPGGGLDQFCRRDGFIGMCHGPMSERVNWIARRDAAGVGELVELQYWPDGTVKRERYYQMPGEVLRREISFAADAHRRPTLAVAGTGSGSFAATAFWDRANNLAGLPSRKSGSSVFCGGPSTSNPDLPANPSCIAMSHDFADRLVAVDEFVNATTQRQMQLGYDDHGGLKEVRSSCVGTTCDVAMKYVYDDFGNVVSTELPTAAGGITKTQYNAFGQVATKETPVMAAASEFLSYEYDLLGRLTKALRKVEGSATSDLLYEYFYDDSSAPPAGCPAPLRSRKGRLAGKRDSFGHTWYDYSMAGRLVAEIRLRDGFASCSSSANDNPHTYYSYNADGNLLSIEYPFGRRVEYQYGADGSARRPTAVSVYRWNGSFWASTTPIADVVWEPFGGLRGYRIKNGRIVLATVELMQGGVASAPPTNACSDAAPTTAGDLTGRTRALWVTSGHAGYGAGSGNILRRFYTWNRDWLERTDTCRLNSGSPVVETYVYDEALRLTGASKSGAGTRGAFESLTWEYDLRGNVGGVGVDSVGLTASYPTGASKDVIQTLANTSTGKLYWYGYQHDADGRVTRKTWRDRAGRFPVPLYRQTFSSYGPGQGSALDSVFRSVNVNGAVYQYFYDAEGKRRLKVYPTGVSDEYFYTPDRELLVDRGVNATSGLGTSDRPVDEYVWLGGVPVAVLRSAISADGSVRLYDGIGSAPTGAACSRNGDQSVCGIYYPVNDYIGKHVMVLDGSGLVAGVSDYDPLGHVNRYRLHAETSHPYGFGENVYLGDVKLPLEGGLIGRARALLHIADMSTSCDKVFLADASSNAAFTTTQLSVASTGNRWTGWTSWGATSAMKLRFTSGLSGECTTAAPTGMGVVSESYEYEAAQSNASKFKIPLRFPGQYHDQETDLFENWHRYYDPLTGRYLQPEPLLRNPKYVESMAAEGVAVPVYAYALNNPVTNFDENGEIVGWVVRLTAQGMKNVRPLYSKEAAVLARRQGENVRMLTRQGAGSVERANACGKPVMRHDGHQLPGGGKGNPHFQTEGKFGHAFWGDPRAGVFALFGAGVLEESDGYQLGALVDEAFESWMDWYFGD